MHFIKGPLQLAANWPLSVKMLEKIQFHTAISEQMSDLPTGSQLEDFCKDFYVSPFLQSTKSSGKEGKAWGPKISGSSLS